MRAVLANPWIVGVGTSLLASVIILWWTGNGSGNDLESSPQPLSGAAATPSQLEPSASPGARVASSNEATTPSATATATPQASTIAASSVASDAPPTLEILDGQDVIGAIENSQDRERWEFTGVEGQFINVRATQEGGASLLPAFRVLEPDGRELAERSTCIQGQRENYIGGLELESSGTHIIEVFGACSSVSGGYRLALTIAPGPTVVRAGDVLEGTLVLRGDFRDTIINLESGDFVSASVVATSGDFLPGVRLLDSSGVVEAQGASCVQGQKQNGFEAKARFSGAYIIRVFMLCGEGPGTFSLSVN